MKKRFIYFFSSMLMCVLLLFGSCSKSDEIIDWKTEKIEDVTSDETSVTIKISASEGESAAFYITSEVNSAPPTAVDVYNSYGTKVLELSDGVASCTFQDLKCATQYKVYSVVKYSESRGYSEVMESQIIETLDFTDFITIIPTDDMYSFKFHIKVPEGKMIAWNALTTDNWLTFQMYGNITPSFVSGHEGLVNVITESQTITFDGWYPPLGADYTDVLPVTPGMSLRLIAAEVQEGGLDHYGRKTYNALYDFGGYMFNGGNVDDYWQTEYHEVAFVQVTPPKVVDAPFVVDVLKRTTKTVEYGITPNEKHTLFAVAHIPKSEYESQVEIFGADGFVNALTNVLIPQSRQVKYSAQNLEEGVDYKLLIIGRTNKEGTEGNLQIVDFTPLVQSKPAPEVIVTGIKAPEGYTDSPWHVWFNIKAPNADAEQVVYMCSSRREMIHLINSGLTYSDAINYNGIAITDIEQLAQINSPEGLNMPFTSLADMEIRLAAVAINDEEVMTDIDSNIDKCVADVRSVPQPAAPRVESELFNSLSGTWNAKLYPYDQIYNAETGAFDFVKATEPIIFDVKIGAEPEYPNVLPESVYALYPHMSKEEVDNLYGEFKTSSTKYAGNVRNQNRLVCEGFYSSHFYLNYQSPYDLFISEFYSQAVTTDDLFFDFGPKWYLQIAEDGSVSIPINSAEFPPMTNHGWSPQYEMGISVEQGAFYPEALNMPVEISTDRDTISIQPAYLPGNNGEFTNYFFSIGSLSYGQVTPTVICAEVILTRGAGETTTALTNSSKKFEYKPIAAPFSRAKTFKRNAIRKEIPYQSAEIVESTEITKELLISGARK